MTGSSMWNERYSGVDYHFGTQPNVSLVRLHSWFSPGGRILSVAEGEGRNGVWLREQGFEVSAFDPSSSACEKAERLARSKGVELDYQQYGIEDYPWPVSHFDGVLAVFIQFASPEERTRLFQNIMRTLKVGGRLVLVGYSPKQLDYRSGGPSLLDHLYTLEMLKSAFAEHQILHAKECNEVLLEGEGHRGLSSFIEWVVERKI